MAKKDFEMAAVRHLEFLKFSYLATWLSPSSKSAFLYQIASIRIWFFVDIWLFNYLQKADVCHREFSKFRVYATWPLLPCYSVTLRKISLKSDNGLLSYGQKRFLKWRPSAILNLKKNHIWSGDCHQVPNLLVWCLHQISSKSDDFCWDMAIWRFSRWQISAILNFRGLVMISLKSLCRDHSLYCLDFEKVAFSCRHFGDRHWDRRTNGRTNRETDGQPQRIKPPPLSRAAA